MNNYFIRKITATGPTVEPSSIDLENGVNIICGPSNTGKSMIVAAINYLFGAEAVPFDPTVVTYDSVSMQLVNEDGELVTIRRGIQVTEGVAKPESYVSIESDVEGIESGDYPVKPGKSKKKSYSDIILGMIGINEPVDLIRTQNRAKGRMSIRSFFHQLCLKESDIFMEDSIIFNPDYKSVTGDIDALAYLLYEGGSADGEYEDPEIKKAKKKAVVDYINGTISSLLDRRDTLSKELEELRDVDIDSRISEITDEIVAVEEEMAAAQNESKDLLNSIYRISDKLGEAHQLSERYRVLHSQYEADIKRLEFIVEGDESADSHIAEHCPFCNGEIHDHEERESYSAASKAELAKVYAQLADLNSLESETALQIKMYDEQLDGLQDRSNGVKSLIERKFKPKANALRSELARYRQYEQLKQELSALDALSQRMQVDAFEKESEDTTIQKYDAKDAFDKTMLANLSSAINKAVKDCHYPDFHVAGVVLNTFDVVVNNKHKKREGKGYRAFLNSLYAFTLMKFLEEYGKHAPKMLILDSPILSLKEEVDDEATDGMKSSLFNHMLDKCGDCQVIIAENELPGGVDYSSANLIEFGTKSPSGRKGFLLSDPEINND